MKETLGKICRNRVLWSVVGILLILTPVKARLTAVSHDESQ